MIDLASPGDCISTSGGRGQASASFKASRCLQWECQGRAELLLSRSRGIWPSPDSRCIPPHACPKLGTFKTALCPLSPNSHLLSKPRFRIPSLTEHKSWISFYYCFSLSPSHGHWVQLIPSGHLSSLSTLGILAAITLATQFLSCALATANLLPATSKLLQSTLDVLLLDWSI